MTPITSAASRATASFRAVPELFAQDWLAAQAQASPQAPALRFAGARWSYAQLDEVVEAWCARLVGLGIQPGVRLAGHLGLRPEAIFLLHAAARLGAPLLLLNTRLAPSELDIQLARVKPALVVGDDRAVLAGLAAPVPRLHLEQLETQAPVVFNPPPFDLAQRQGIIFTSGTSGTPKGVELTFANHFWNALGSAARLGMLPGDRWLSPLPLYHVGGAAAAFRCCLYGVELELCPAEVPALAEALANGATLVSLVPTVLRRLLGLADLSTPALRLVLLGGAAAPPELLQQAAARGLRIAVSYGLTEAASQVCTAAPDLVLAKPGCVGRPLLNVQVRLVGALGAECKAGEVGEILVRGPTVMAGYLDELQATQQAVQAGWLHTGDLGYLDEQGDLWLVQRRSDLIVSGGENVYPAEVEAVLLRHPAIAQACVVGVADREWGQRVAAALVLQPGARLDPQELIDFSRKWLAGYKLPRTLRLVETLPLTASGKIARAKVRALFEAVNG